MISPARTEFVTLIANVALACRGWSRSFSGLPRFARRRDRRERLTIETLRNFQIREFAAIGGGVMQEPQARKMVAQNKKQAYFCQT